MADVYIVTLSLLGILLSFPALLVCLNLTLPQVIVRVETRLEQTPGRSFVLGGCITAALFLWIAVTSQLGSGLVRTMAFVSAIAGMGIGAVGAAGMARLLGKRLSRLASPNSELTSMIRGAVVYELACLFPIVGWFLFLPFVGITLMGAAAFGLLRWIPGPAAVHTAIDNTV